MDLLLVIAFMPTGHGAMLAAVVVKILVFRAVCLVLYALVAIHVLKEIKKEIGSNVSDAQAMSKEAAQQMYAELTKGQDVIKPNVTPEMIAGAITGSVSGMDGVDPEALKQFNQALIGLLTVKPTEDEHDGS